MEEIWGFLRDLAVEVTADLVRPVLLGLTGIIPSSAAFLSWLLHGQAMAAVSVRASMRRALVARYLV